MENALASGKYWNYWAAGRYYLIRAEYAQAREKQAYLRKSSLARNLANAELRGRDGIDANFYASRFDVTPNTIKRDVREIHSRAAEPDLVERVRISLSESTN